jgi:hypothetical protein
MTLPGTACAVDTKFTSPYFTRLFEPIASVSRIKARPASSNHQLTGHAGDRCTEQARRFDKVAIGKHISAGIADSSNLAKYATGSGLHALHTPYIV